MKSDPASRFNCSGKSSSFRRRRLVLESLEARRLLAVFNWVGAGGDGSWSNTANWSLTSGTNNGTAGIPDAGDDAVFNATTPQLAVNQDVAGLTLGSLTLSSPTAGYTLAGNSISASTQILDSATSGINSLNLVLAGASVLQKTGAATLNLGSSNSYSGLTTISGGVVNLNANQTIRIGNSLTINAGATVNMAAANDALRDLADITIDGGTLADTSTASPHNHAIFVSNGRTLNMRNGGTITSLGAGTGNTTYGQIFFGFGGTQINVSGTGNNTFNARIHWGSANGTGNINVATGATLVVAEHLGNQEGFQWGYLSLSGGGTLIMTDSTSIQNTVTVGVGATLQIGNGGTTGDFPNGAPGGAGTIVNNGTVVFNRSNDYTLSRTISGTGGIIQAGTGITTIPNGNSYTGTTTVNNGKLVITGSISAASPVVVNAPGFLSLVGNNATGNANGATTTGSYTINGGTISNDGAANITQVINGNLNLLNGGTLAATSPFNTTYGNFVIFTNDGPQVNVSGTSASTISAVLSLAGNHTFNVADVAPGVDLLVSGRVVGTNNVLSGAIKKAGTGTLSLANPLNATNPVGGLALTGVQLAAGEVVFVDGGLGNGVSYGGGALGLIADFTGNAKLTWAPGNTQDISVGGLTKIEDGAIATLDTGGNNVTLATALAVGTLRTGGVTKVGTGTLTLTANNTFTGPLTVNAGTLAAAAGNTATGAVGSSNSIVVNNGGTITVGGDNSFVGHATSASRTIQINAGGTITNLGSSTNHLNALILNGGTLSSVGTNGTYGIWNFDQGVSTLGNSSTSTISGGNAALSQIGGTIFNIGAGDTVNVSTVLAHVAGAGDTGLIKTGTGTLVLSGANTYTSGTTVSQGTLRTTNGTGFGTLGVTLGDLGTGASSIVLSLGTTIANNITVSSSGTGPVTIYGDAQYNNHNGTLTLNRTATLQIPTVGGGATDWWYAFGNGGISGGGGLVIKGGGGNNNRVTLNAANSFTGGIVVESGRVQLGNATSAGTGSITLGNANSGTAVSELRVGANIANPIIVSASAPNSPSVVGTYNGLQSFTGPLQIDHPLTINGAGDRLTWTSAAAVWSGSANVTIAGGRVTHDTAANTWTGNLTINASSIFQPGSTTTLTAAISVTVNGTLQLNNVPQTINGLSGTGTVQNVVGGNTLTVGAGNADATFTGVLQNNSGVLSLIKAGSGTQTLGSATYPLTGTVTVNGGTLSLFNAIAYNSPTTVNNGAKLSWTGNADVQNNNTAPITLNNGATLENRNPNNYTVIVLPVTVTAGASVTLIQDTPATSTVGKGFFLDGGLKGSGTVTINSINAGTSVHLRNNNSTFAGKIIVNGIASPTTYVGSGISVGGNTTGLQNADIELNGTMELLNQGIGWANGAPGDFRMGALSGGGVIVGNFTAGGITRFVLGNTNVDGIFSGVIADGTGNIVQLTKIGTGKQTFTGNNTYTGSTTISAGTLQVGSGGTSGAIGPGAIVNNAALIFSRSDTIDLLPTNTITGTGTLTANAGAGTIGVRGNITQASVSLTSTLATSPLTLYGSNYSTGINLFADITTTGNQAYNGVVSIGRGSAPNPITNLTTTAGGSVTLTGGAISGVGNYWSAGTLNINTSAGNGAVSLGGTTLAYGVGNLNINSGTANTTLTGGRYYYDYSVFANNVVLTGNATFQPSTQWVRGVQFNGSLTGAFTLTTTLGNGAASTSGTGTSGLVFNTLAPSVVSAILAGGAGPTKTGPSTLTLTAANTYTGLTTVNAGTLIVPTGGSISSGAGGFTISGAAAGNPTLQLEGGTINTAGNFNVGVNTNDVGTVQINSGTFNMTGGLFTLGNASGGGTVTTFNQTGGTFNYSSGGNFIMDNWAGLSTVNLSGGVFNQTAGRLQLTQRGTGIVNISGTADVRTPQVAMVGWTTPSSAGTINLDGGTLTTNRIAPNEIGQATQGTSTFNFNGGTLKAAASVTDFLQGLSAVNVRAGGAIIDTNGQSITIAQPLLAGAPSGGLSKQGAGTLLLNGASTYTGATTVVGGTLGGDGGVVSPIVVQSPAVLAPGGSPGDLASGSLTLTSGSSFAVEINNPTPVTGYDQLVVTGAVTLGGATLAATISTAQPLASAFVLIKNDGTDAVVGTFLGRPEGSTVVVGGVGYRISYVYNAEASQLGTGNDVALIRVDPPVAVGENFTTNEDVPLAENVKTNDTSSPGFPASVVVVTQPNGTLVMNTATGQFTYTPPEDFSGTTSFTYYLQDGDLSSATVTTTITVVAVADEPTINLPAPLPTGGEMEVVPLGLSAISNDNDGSESVSITISNVPTNAVLVHRLTLVPFATSTFTQAELPFVAIRKADDNLAPLPDSFPLTITATATETSNGSTATTTRILTVTVNNLPPEPELVDISVAGQSQPLTSSITIVPGVGITFGVTTTDPAADSVDAPFRFVINWGDGTATSMSTTLDEGELAEFTHVYTVYGTFPVTLTVTDKDGGSTQLALTTVTSAKVAKIDDTLFVGAGPAADRIVIQTANGGVAARINNVLSAGFSGIDKVVVFGMAGADTISVTGNVPAVEFYGGAGDDYLAGGNLSDTLDGGDGTDRLIGGGGDDLLLGGAGNDTLAGGAGNDLIFGDDYLDVQGNQLTAAIGGKDTLNGDAGNDQLNGGAGLDTLYGGAGNDLLRGGNDSDTLDGGDGNDILLGEAGGDKLYGRGGLDVLIGGGGVDNLLGGVSADLLYSGDLADDATLLALAQLWFQGQQTTAVDQLSDIAIDDLLGDSLNGEGDTDWYVLFKLDSPSSTEKFPANNKTSLT